MVLSCIMPNGFWIKKNLIFEHTSGIGICTMLYQEPNNFQISVFRCDFKSTLMVLNWNHWFSSITSSKEITTIYIPRALGSAPCPTKSRAISRFPFPEAISRALWYISTEILVGPMSFPREIFLCTYPGYWDLRHALPSTEQYSNFPHAMHNWEHFAYVQLMYSSSTQ